MTLSRWTPKPDAKQTPPTLRFTIPEFAINYNSLTHVSRSRASLRIARKKIDSSHTSRPRRCHRHSSIWYFKFPSTALPETTKQEERARRFFCCLKIEIKVSLIFQLRLNWAILILISKWKQFETRSKSISIKSFFTTRHSQYFPVRA